MTLGRIKIEESMIRPKGMMVHTFDGTKTATCGEIYLKMLIRPCDYDVSCVVVEIPAVFNLLIGRPWCHNAGVIPSSFHQKVEFIQGISL